MVGKTQRNVKVHEAASQQKGERGIRYLKNILINYFEYDIIGWSLRYLSKTDVRLKSGRKT
jgi:hypothetical protein